MSSLCAIAYAGLLAQIGESAIGSAATAPDLQASEGQPWQWCFSDPDSHSLVHYSLSAALSFGRSLASFGADDEFLPGLSTL
eukprot:SAG11_NODE_460_length_9258_cov_3.010698_4_plen_82_part_00